MVPLTDVLFYTGILSSHLGFDLFQQRFQLVHVGLLLWPLDTQSLLLIRLRYDVKMDMVYLLVSQATIVLQDVVVVVSLSSSNLLGHWEQLSESVVGDIGQFGTVVLGDDKL